MIVSMRVRRGAPIVLALLGLAACADSVTGPVVSDEPTDQGAVGASPSLSRGKGLHRVKAHKTYDHDSKNTIYTFTIDPKVAQLVSIGEHTVYLPSNVICDPATTSYGRGEWDKPCSVARDPIVFRAISGKRQGHAAVEFEPDVRFAPAAERQPWRWVILTLKDTKELHDQKDYSILWWDAGAESNSGNGVSNPGEWVDEAASDPSLRAWTDRRGNRVARRLKHFSGYNVTSGRSGGLRAGR